MDMLTLVTITVVTGVPPAEFTAQRWQTTPQLAGICRMHAVAINAQPDKEGTKTVAFCQSPKRKDPPIK